jgi:predicted RecB family nuclease
MEDSNIQLLLIDEVIKDKLREAGYKSIEELVAAGADKLDDIKGIGPATAQMILAACAEVNGSDPTPAPKGDLYIACTPIKHDRDYKPGEIFNISGLTEKAINRLLENGAIKLQESKAE